MYDVNWIEDNDGGGIWHCADIYRETALSSEYRFDHAGKLDETRGDDWMVPVMFGDDKTYAIFAPPSWWADTERKPGSMPDLVGVPDEFFDPLSDDEVADWE